MEKCVIHQLVNPPLAAITSTRLKFRLTVFIRCVLDKDQNIEQVIPKDSQTFSCNCMSEIGWMVNLRTTLEDLML